MATGFEPIATHPTEQPNTNPSRKPVTGSLAPNKKYYLDGAGITSGRRLRERECRNVFPCKIYHIRILPNFKSVLGVP